MEMIDLVQSPKNHLSCEGCEREIPATALWSACARKARLQCRECRRQVTHESLSRLAESSEFAKAALVAFAQLVRYGWTSADAIENAGVHADPRALGGLITGLQRAGFIRKAEREPRNPVLSIVDPKPVFLPGPMFPKLHPDVKTAIRSAAPSVEFAH